MTDIAHTDVHARSAEYERGYRDAMEKCKNKMFVTFGEEVNMPVEWDGFTDQEEQEAIASIVETREYQEHFRVNLQRQAMLKWRQARLAMANPQMVHFLFMVGNAIMELIEHYDRAKDTNRPTVDPDAHGYDSSLPEL